MNGLMLLDTLAEAGMVQRRRNRAMRLYIPGIGWLSLNNT